MNDSKLIEQTNKKSPLIIVGTIALLVSTVASGSLVGTKLGYISTLPGCGPGSSCDAITNGPWGTIPFIGWPVSFLGLAWFVGMLWGWLKSSGNSHALLCLARAGAVASIGFIVLMGSLGTFCKWCVLAHISNIVFWGIAELLRRPKSPQSDCPSATVPFVKAFVLSTVALAIALQFVPTLGKVVDTSTLQLLDARHRIGPEDAPVQIVMFTDYQCPDCFRYEKQLADLVEASDDISVSVKHFPLCYDCNDNIGTFKLHGNACWAARAAEAASIVGGEPSWEKMHDWLFSQKGAFTDATLPQSLLDLGFDPNVFIGIMTSDETLQRVKQEADDGFGLGVYFTPMIFINGVEWLWYYGGQGSLENAIAQVRARSDGNVTAPPIAVDKLLEDWRRGQAHALPDQDGRAWLGKGSVEFVVWGDYQADATKKLDAEIKKLIGADDRVKYSYRHFPLDETCNAAASKSNTTYEGSCFLAKLVESLDVLGGSEPRWALHDWMFQRTSTIRNSVALAKAAAISGVDQATIQDVMEGIELNNRMRSDIASKSRVWRRSIPVLVVDGRFVPRWGGDGVDTQDLFQRIVSVVESEVSSSTAGTSR
jgi:protein-disulfide isomerase